MSTYKIGVEVGEKGTGKTVSELKKLDKALNDSGGTLNDVIGGTRGDLSSLGGIAEKLGAKIPIPFAAGAAAAAGLATAVVSVGKQLFDMAERASEFGSAIKDASDKTGLSAETLSSLKLAADQSGSSLEQISGSVTKFSKLIGEAAEGSDSAKESLIRLGLDPNEAIKDLDGSLATVFKRIADAQNPIIATKLATEAFGKSGADLIPVIKSFDGDMAGLIKRAKELGVAIDDDAANAADDFGDTLDTLKAQTAGVANQFAFQFMPIMTGGMKDLSGYFSQNKDAVEAWGQSVGNVLAGIIQIFKDVSSFMDEHPLLVKIALAGGGQLAYQAIESYGKNNRAESLGAGAKPQLGGTLEDFDGDKKRQDELKKRLAEFGEANKLALEGLRQTYESSQKAWESSLADGSHTFDQYKQGILDNIDEFARAARELLAQGFKIDSEGKTGQSLTNEQTAYNNALAKFNDEIDSQKAELAKKQLDTQKKSSDESIKVFENEISRKSALAKASTQTRLAQLELDLQRGQITELQYAQSSATIQNSSLEDEKARNQELLKTLDKKSEKYAEVTQKIKLLDEELAQQQIANAKQVESAWENATVAREKFADRGEQGVDRNAPPAHAPTNWLQDWLDLGTVQSQADIYKGIVTDMRDITTGAFGQMGEAVGQSIASWVLYGDAVGVSLKQATAAVLAQVAQQAAVKAIFELAEGFAALAVGDGVGASMHFTAAEIYGTVAAAAALAGRALAGGKNQGQGSNSDQPDYYTSNPQTNVQTNGQNTQNRQLQESVSSLADAVDNMHGKISGMRPGDVLTVGAKEKPGFISQQNINELKSNGSKATDLGKALRMT